MTLVDLPGIGETPQHDQEYRALYRQLLPELDLIIWILRADERAYAADIAVHQFLLNEGADPSRFLFVLSHADRVFPAEEWNATEKCPSRHRELSLATVTARWQPCSRHHFRYSPLLRLSAGIFRRLCR